MKITIQGNMYLYALAIGDLSAGLKALIALVVIAVVALVPIIYAVVRRRQGKPVIPQAFQPMWKKIMPCCLRTKGVR